MWKNCYRISNNGRKITQKLRGLFSLGLVRGAITKMILTSTEQFGTVARRQTEYYGACTSIRVWYEGGPEVEFGLVEPSWIARPLDAGTMQVLQGGYRVILDKKQRFPSCVPPPYTSPFNK